MARTIIFDHQYRLPTTIDQKEIDALAAVRIKSPLLTRIIRGIRRFNEATHRNLEGETLVGLHIFDPLVDRIEHAHGFPIDGRHSLQAAFINEPQLVLRIG
ncbi:hypothetical protein S101447_01820 [Acetobacter ascendens]|uniref:Uncharacterized protein n=1 Tax=Acetobacter ascendens TaxID=481146 RepID=A0A1Y0UYE4_9PROT|nr:hypothetical protein S101447_01820 [Acetobacter ascendens]